MKTILNKRLYSLSAYLHIEDKIIDIGCDHAKLGIYLCLKYHNMKIVASDIKKGPLLIAQKNISRYKLDDRITLRLGNGLDCLDNDIDTIVISGMGSQTIINILEKINNYPHVKKLVLSPNNDFSLLREKIISLGFYIYKEEIIKESDKYYLIIEFHRGKELDIDYYFGKLDLDNSVNREYYQMIYQKNKIILEKNYQEELIKINCMIEEKIMKK